MKKDTEKTVMFWSRLTREKGDEWVLAAGKDASGVPLAVWKTFNKRFWEMKSQGRFYPLDALDAYQMAAHELIRTANGPNGASHQQASHTTYLVATAFTALRSLCAHQVAAQRQQYADLSRHARALPAADESADRAEDRTDREWSDPTATTLNAQFAAENLPDGEDVIRRERHRERRARERACLIRRVRATIASLDEEACAGLTAWLDANGVWLDAARRWNPLRSVQAYVYLFRTRWTRAFRAVWEAGL